jgi:hypothetical protein
LKARKICQPGVAVDPLKRRKVKILKGNFLRYCRCQNLSFVRIMSLNFLQQQARVCLPKKFSLQYNKN